MWTTLLACTVLIGGSVCLRLVRLDVPHAIVNGDPIWLNCSFDLESDELYSVKWYKNNVEFYRYLPSDDPPAQKYDLLGVYLDVLYFQLYRTKRGHIYLYKTDLNSEGTYRCEVSAEAPSFQTVREEKDMKTYVMPEKPPTIAGIQPHYGIGEEINVTCIAGPSKPPSTIQWFINGLEAPKDFLFSYSPKRYKTGLLSGQVGLRFNIASVNYWDESIKLRCLTNFTQLYYMSSEEMVIDNKPSNIRFKSAPGYGRDGPTISQEKWNFDMGDTVSLNCTSTARPTPQLQWLINDVTAPSEYVTMYESQEHNNRKVILGLRFLLEHHHFVNNQLRLNCTATLSAVVTLKTEQTVIGGSQQTSGLQMSPNRAAGLEVVTQETHLVLVLFCLQAMRFS